MKTKILWLTIFGLIISVGYRDAKACSCINPNTPIEEYKTSPIVFVGKVTSIAEDKAKIERFGREGEVRTGLVAYLDITEPFKGTKQKVATIVTGGGGGDCGFPFEVGKSYFVFASALNSNNSENIVAATVFGNPNPSEKKLIGDAMTTHICTMTNDVDYLQNELEMIRAYLKGAPQPRVYGRIREYVYEFDGAVTSKFVGFVPNIKVVAEGKKGNFEGVTDKDGAFSIKNLPLGKYNLKFLLPPAYMNLWSWEKFEYPIEIKTKEDSFEQSVDTQTSGEIRGTLFDRNGKYAPDQVQLSLIPVEYINDPNPEKHSRSEYVKQSGRYIFDGVKAGKYILGINIAESPAKHTPYPKIYYPSGSDASKAQIIEIKTGQKLTNIDFKLPKELEKFVVEGTVLDTKGKPVSEAGINIFDAETPNETVFGFSSSVKTDVNGRFKITGFKGRKYLLHAYKDTNYLAGRGIQSERIEMIFDESAKPATLILNKNGIFIDQLK